MELMWIVWIAAIVFFGVVEAATVNMVSLWFVGGAAAALIVQILGGPVWLQVLLFFVVSAGLLLALRPFVKKYVAPNHTATNADMVLGKEAYITETVDNLLGTGALKLEGKTWTVRSVGGNIIPEGTLVRVVKIEGVKLLVETVFAPVSL